MERLLEGSGFGLTLLDCRRRLECKKPGGPDLVLRILRGRHPTDPKVCGDALPGSEGRPGLLMTIYRRCVTETAIRLHQLAVRPTGKALLLPGELHGSGISKAVFDVDVWQRAARGDLRLASATATRLRAVLAVPGAVRTGR